MLPTKRRDCSHPLIASLVHSDGSNSSRQLPMLLHPSKIKHSYWPPLSLECSIAKLFGFGILTYLSNRYRSSFLSSFCDCNQVPVRCPSCAIKKYQLASTSSKILHVQSRCCISSSFSSSSHNSPFPRNSATWNNQKPLLSPRELSKCVSAICNLPVCRVLLTLHSSCTPRSSSSPPELVHLHLLSNISSLIPLHCLFNFPVRKLT